METSLEAFGLFCENVLKDEDFIKLIEDRRSDFQRDFVSKARVLQQRLQIEGQVLAEDVSKLAVELGAFTYQHAYFVDSRMAEAVASYGDTGLTRIVGLVNRTVSLCIPYHDTLSLKGYGDEESQSMFQGAGIFSKALLIKKANYNRDVFFRSEK